MLNKRGRLAAQGRRPAQEAADDLLQPQAALDRGLLRAVDLRLRDADSTRRRRSTSPVARPKSLITGKDMNDRVVAPTGTTTSAARASTRATRRRCCKGIEDKVKLEFEQTFMFYLPRICEHCLNPSCAASCPSGRDLQARGGRHRPGRPGPLPRLADVRRRAAPTRRSTSTTRPARPRSARSATRASRSACPTVCSETCVGRLRYIGLVLYDADKVLEAASHRGRARPLRGPARRLPRPRATPRCSARPSGPASPATGSRPPSASPI